MKLYRVTGNIFSGESIPTQYLEKVVVYEVEERKKTFTCAGRRFRKDDIGKVLQWMFTGSYCMYVLDESEINDARIKVAKAVFKYWQDQLTKAQNKFNAIKEWNVSREVKIFDYDLL
jgi:hypothetical protein